MKEAVFSIPYSGLMSDSEWKTLEEEAEITKCRDLETGRAPDGYGWAFNPASHPSTEEHRTIWVRTCDEVFQMIMEDPRFELIEELTEEDSQG